MKALALLLILAPAIALADRTWRTADTIREVTWQALNVADTATTMEAARLNDEGGRRVYGPNGGFHVERFQEKNPLLGADPSPRRVRNMMALGAAAHAGISYLLPHGWRDAWQYVTILESAHCVDNNLSIGLKVRF